MIITKFEEVNNMKKLILTISFILIFVLLIGCAKTDTGNETNDISSTPEPTDTVTAEITEKPEPTQAVAEPTPQVTEESLTIADYFPLNENTKYIYEGEGNEYASYSVFTDYISKNRIQLRTNNGGSELVRVLENKDGQLTVLLSRGEIYYRENLLNSTDENTEILLKEPLVKGTEWTLADKRKRFISNVDVEITTPAETFQALEVTTEGEDDKVVDYYAAEVGLIKSIFTSGGMDVTSTLSKIEENVPFEQTIRFYYPNVNEDVIYLVEKQLLFNTNDITKIELVDAIKDIKKDNLDPVLSSNTKINSLYLNKDNVVYVDFTKELLSEMNAGSGYETLILQCITNTLGDYYGVKEVYITVDGKPYESGHYSMKKGEAFQADMENVVE